MIMPIVKLVKALSPRVTEIVYCRENLSALICGKNILSERLGYRVTILLYCDCCLPTGNKRLCHTSTL